MTIRVAEVANCEAFRYVGSIVLQNGCIKEVDNKIKVGWTDGRWHHEMEYHDPDKVKLKVLQDDCPTIYAIWHTILGNYESS